MSTVSKPYGLKPLKKQGSQPNGGAIREFKMTTNSSAGIFTGDPVAINSGSPVAAAATPTTTRGTSTPVGVCVGVRYTDPVTKCEMHAAYLPANAITNGYTNVYIKVDEDPDTLYLIKADETVAASALGKNAPLVIGSGDTVYGLSGVSLDGSLVATTATLAVRIVDFYTAPGSDVGDAYTECIVRWNAGVHAYTNSTGG